ncbi:hypothetical protein DEO72_LG3g82 [Vigna unguiculata]|uniref:Uncharacterized protein n=1 Tax=Vigna unguiculata TaxID=3917 RepID=A0A4D6LAK0_VIGUN|nr:hypothetical protein DEO72_LG3g82 [Vigna unguiculata]
MASVVRGTEAIDPLLAPGLLGPRPISHFLASGPSGPRPIPLFGTGFERTGAYTALWLRVFGEPRPKTWL